MSLRRPWTVYVHFKNKCSVYGGVKLQMSSWRWDFFLKTTDNYFLYIIVLHEIYFIYYFLCVLINTFEFISVKKIKNNSIHFYVTKFYMKKYIEKAMYFIFTEYICYIVILFIWKLTFTMYSNDLSTITIDFV